MCISACDGDRKSASDVDPSSRKRDRLISRPMIDSPQRGKNQNDRSPKFGLTYRTIVESTQTVLIEQNERNDIDWKSRLTELSSDLDVSIEDICKDLLAHGDLTDMQKRAVSLKIYESFKSDPRFLMDLLSNSDVSADSLSIIVDSVREDLVAKSDCQSLVDFYPLINDRRRRNQWAEATACVIVSKVGIDQAVSWIQGINDYSERVNAFIAVAKISSIHGDVGDYRLAELAKGVINDNDFVSNLRFERIINDR